MFQEVIITPGLTYWQGKLYDAIVGDCPVFRHKPSKTHPPTPLRVARAFCGQLNEARGIVRMQYVQEGIPVWSGAFAGNGQIVFCVTSSDETFCPVDRSILEALNRQETQWYRSLGGRSEHDDH